MLKHNFSIKATVYGATLSSPSKVKFNFEHFLLVTIHNMTAHTLLLQYNISLQSLVENNLIISPPQPTFHTKQFSYILTSKTSLFLADQRFQENTEVKQTVNIWFSSLVAPSYNENIVIFLPEAPLWQVFQNCRNYVIRALVHLIAIKIGMKAYFCFSFLAQWDSHFKYPSYKKC